MTAISLDCPIAVVGAGIAGLSAAIALHHEGFRDIRVLERGSIDTTGGFGLNLSPTAVGILDRLGVLEQIRGNFVESRHLVLRAADGSTLWRQPRRHEGANFPHISLIRGELIGGLLRALERLIGPDRILQGHEYDGCDNYARPTCVFARSKGHYKELPAHVIIGADGLQSRVRRDLHPFEGAPRQFPMDVWRGVASMSSYVQPSEMLVHGLVGARLVTYPVLLRDDQLYVNWVAAFSPEHHADQLCPDDERQIRASLATFYRSWEIRGFDVGELFAETPNVRHQSLRDRDPLWWWGMGNSIVLGDAAHPMLPMGSSGATQAVIDAPAFAGALSRTLDVRSSVKVFHELRRSHLHRLQLLNRVMGPERIIDEYYSRLPESLEVNGSLCSTERAEIGREYHLAATAGSD